MKKTRTTTRTRRETAFVTISDLHVGSDVALWPPGFRTVEKDIPKPQSAFQEWLWSCWLEIPDIVRRLAPRATRRILVVNGDVVDGFHHWTVEQMVHTSTDQKKALQMVMEPFRQLFDGFLLTKGTECHSQLAECSLGEYLGPDCIAVMDKLRVHHNGVHMIWRHHMSTTGRVHLESSALKNEMAQEVLEAARCNYPIPRVLTAAHRHIPDVLTDKLWLVGVTGPWQGLTRYAHKVARHGVAKPSVLVYDFSGKGVGELPEARQHVWVPKLQEAEVINIA